MSTRRILTIQRLGAIPFLLLFFNWYALGEELRYSFPDKPVGRVRTYGGPTHDGPFVVLYGDERERFIARGSINIPEDSFVDLILDKDSVQDLSFLSRLPRDGMHSIQISDATVSREVLRAIAQVLGLIAVRFHSCQLTSDAFRNAPALPELLFFELDTPGISVAQQDEIAEWLMQQTKLEFVRITPSLRANSLALLVQHPALNFINLQVGPDSRADLEELARLKGIRGVTLEVSNDADPQTLEALGDLEELELINWQGGKVKGSVLQRLAARNRMRTLRLQGVVLESDFIKGLGQMTGLTELQLDPSNDSDSEILAQLPSALFGMKKLRRWPTIHRPDWTTLQEISDSDQIESLSISDIGVRVHSRDLAVWNLQHLRSLKELTLQNVPVDDAWLETLAACTELRKVGLHATRVVGPGFQELSELNSLQSVSLTLVQDVPPDLSSLASIPNLERVWISGAFLLPRHLEPLSRCKNLRNLNLFGGMIDDSTVGWIASMPNLSDLGLSCDCVVSDAGMAQLAKMKLLQNLRMEAPLATASGVESLLAAPSLQFVWLGLNVSNESAEELRLSAAHVPSFILEKARRALVRGDDGFLREHALRKAEKSWTRWKAIDPPTSGS